MEGKRTTRKGETLNIKDMNSYHITCTINMLERNMPDHDEDECLVADHWSLEGLHSVVEGADTYREKIKEMKEELIRRGFLNVL